MPSDRPSRPRGGSKPGPKPAGKGRPPARGKPAHARRPTDKPKPGAQLKPPGPRDPHIADDVTADQLDPAVLNELRTLPEGLADIVARHLVAADRALVDEDLTAARAHVAAAKRRAGRVRAVREAAGITAYLDGDYAEAAAELRTVRRMTGTDEFVPMLADCERGLGRPERALDLIREVDITRVEPEVRVELALVAAGARADLGQIDAALVLLQGPELRRLPKGTPRARLQYAYAELLEQAGRHDEAEQWMRKAADSDVEGVTDAGERVDELAGVAFIEERGAPE